MKEFIYQADSLSPNVCDNLVKLFEENKRDHYFGVVGDINENNNIINKSFKNTIDLNLDLENITRDNCWYDNIKILSSEIKVHIQKYFVFLKNNFNGLDFNLVYKQMHTKNFLLHKYIKNEGRFLYHNDFQLDTIENKYRIFNILWYLNDVDEGGETEFFGNYCIKPEKGKIVIFPSEWFFPHSGRVPLSNDKMIITAWLYVYF